MSSDISSSATWRERSAAVSRSSGDRQPLLRRIAYVFIGASSVACRVSLYASGAYRGRGRAAVWLTPAWRGRPVWRGPGPPDPFGAGRVWRQPDLLSAGQPTRRTLP